MGTLGIDWAITFWASIPYPMPDQNGQSELKRYITFIHSVVPSKTIPGARPKWTKCIPVFIPKRRKNPTRWDGTYLYGLYKGVSPRVYWTHSIAPVSLENYVLTLMFVHIFLSNDHQCKIWAEIFVAIVLDAFSRRKFPPKFCTWR